MNSDIPPKEEWLDPLIYRFGFPPELFEDYTIFRSGSKNLAIVASDHEAAVDSRASSTGIVFVRTHTAFPKLTSAAVMMFGNAATRNVIDVDRIRADLFLSRKSFPVSLQEAAECFTGPGYVILRFDGIALGLGLFRQSASGDGEIESLFPGAWALK